MRKWMILFGTWSFLFFNLSFTLVTLSLSEDVINWKRKHHSKALHECAYWVLHLIKIVWNHLLLFGKGSGKWSENPSVGHQKRGWGLLFGFHPCCSLAHWWHPTTRSSGPLWSSFYPNSAATGTTPPFSKSLLRVCNTTPLLSPTSFIWALSFL